MSESEKSSSKKKRKKEASSGVADEGLRGLFTRLPLPGVNGHAGGDINFQDDDEGEREKLLKEEGEEEKKEEEDVRVQNKTEKEMEAEKEKGEPRIFRIQSVGSSEMSASVTVPRPVIRVTLEDKEDKELSDRREQELAGATLPPLMSRPNGLDIPPERRKRGTSAGPFSNYGAVQSTSISVNKTPLSESPAPSPGSGRRRLRKTISGEQNVCIGKLGWASAFVCVCVCG